jgi:hypothetical protein
MATKRTVILECDYPTPRANLHDSEAKTHTFSLDGEPMEIDLCDKHWGMLSKAMTPFTASARSASAVVTGRMVAASRPTGKRRGRPPGSKNGMRAAPSVSEASKIRAWALTKGFKVAERGRISPNIKAEYAAANA